MVQPKNLNPIETCQLHGDALGIQNPTCWSNVTLSVTTKPQSQYSRIYRTQCSIPKSATTLSHLFWSVFAPSNLCPTISFSGMYTKFASKWFSNFSRFWLSWNQRSFKLIPNATHQTSPVFLLRSQNGSSLASSRANGTKLLPARRSMVAVESAILCSKVFSIRIGWCWESSSKNSWWCFVLMVRGVRQICPIKVLHDWNSWDAITLQASCLALGWTILVQYLKLNCLEHDLVFPAKWMPCSQRKRQLAPWIPSIPSSWSELDVQPFNMSAVLQWPGERAVNYISLHILLCQTCFPISQLNGWFLFSSLPLAHANLKSFCSTSLGNHPRTARLPTVTKNFRLIGGGDVRKNVLHTWIHLQILRGTQNKSVVF